MNQTVDNLFQAAMNLPDDDQLQLATMLNAALEERGFKPLDDWWLTEIKQRSAQFDAGLVAPTPWEEVREELYRNLSADG